MNVLAERTVLYLHGARSSPVRPLATVRRGQYIVSQEIRSSLIDYRLAPEHPSSAVQDALAAYEWLSDSGVCGSHCDCGGFGRRQALALDYSSNSRSGMPTPCACCVSLTSHRSHHVRSIVDSKRTEGLRREPKKDSRVIQAVSAGTDPRTPLASPWYADLRGLPPLLIQVGAHDASSPMRRGWLRRQAMRACRSHWKSGTTCTK